MDKSPAWPVWMDTRRTTRWQKVCVYVCVCLFNAVYLQCVTLGNVPVVGRVSSGDVCVCLCLGFCTVSSAVAKGKLVCVGSVVSVCVCVCVQILVCRCLHGAARFTWSSTNPFVNTQGTPTWAFHIEATHTHTHIPNILFLSPWLHVNFNLHTYTHFVKLYLFKVWCCTSGQMQE